MIKGAPIMGILNVTPDSFSDGGIFTDAAKAVAHARAMIEAGASVIDVGAESTGPGSLDLTEAEELARLVPVIEALKKENLLNRALFSIDTYKAGVAQYALQNGFGMVNDVTALRSDPRMMTVLLQHYPQVVLMYSKDPTARTTVGAVDYADVMQAVKDFLLARAQLLIQAGYAKDRIWLDPGLGHFVSANAQYSFEILDRLPELCALGHPVLVGVSRKSFLGGSIENRDEASIKYSQKAVYAGASLVRVHNVAGMAGVLSC